MRWTNGAAWWLLMGETLQQMVPWCKQDWEKLMESPGGPEWNGSVLGLEPSAGWKRKCPGADEWQSRAKVGRAGPVAGRLPVEGWPDS